MPGIIGLDLSLTSTGVCSKEGSFAYQAKTKGMERLADIRDGVMLVVAAQNDPIVVVEGYSFSSRNSQSHALGELGGVVRLALYEAGVSYIYVPPTSRAKLATGKGNASKNEVVYSISARTGIVWSGKGADDMCDAWILRQMGLAHLGESEYDWPAVNMTALDKIDWSGFPSA
jgi:crossover junction endodeoxyribonuclease RuvC